MSLVLLMHCHPMQVFSGITSGRILFQGSMILQIPQRVGLTVKLVGRHLL
jgi:hypothetical protein